MFKPDFMKRKLNTLLGNFHTWSWRPVWNILKEDEDKQDLEDFGLDQYLQLLGGIILQPK